MKSPALICALIFAAGVAIGGWLARIDPLAWAADPAPSPCESGDANGDGDINITDPIYLLQYLFGHGPAPVECSTDTTVIYLLRHGERDGEELGPLGWARAEHLSLLLAGVHIDNLVATDRPRTRQMLEPILASKENLTEIEIVDSFDQGVTTLAAIGELRPGSRAVIASHSTEIDDILRGLGATEAQFSVPEYDRIWVVTLRPGEDADAVEFKYCVAPDCPVVAAQ